MIPHRHSRVGGFTMSFEDSPSVRSDSFLYHISQQLSKHSVLTSKLHCLNKITKHRLRRHVHKSKHSEKPTLYEKQCKTQ